MKTKWGSNTESVLRLLGELGPMTRLELETELGIAMSNTNIAMYRLHHASPQRPKRVHIFDWRLEEMKDGRRGWKPVYALGNKPDKKRPKLQTTVRVYRGKPGNPRKARSIFDLACDPRTNAAKRREQSLKEGIEA